MRDAANGFDSLDDFYERGPFGGIVKERRSPQPASAKLLMLSPPPGHYPKPPTPDFNLVMTVNSPHRASLDLGAGRFRKMLVPGDMGFQPANSAADILVDDPHQVLILSIPEQVAVRRLAELGTDATDFGALHAGAFRDSLMEQLCRRMWTETQDGGALGPLFVDSAVATLITLLHGLAGRLSGSMASRGGIPPNRLRRVLELVHERLGADLRLDELAAAAGMSASHFVRCFRNETGLSPHRYLVQARVERAKELLATSDLPVVAIAEMCGFSSTGHLAQWFRRVTGASPSDYRRLI